MKATSFGLVRCRRLARGLSSTWFDIERLRQLTSDSRSSQLCRKCSSIGSAQGTLELAVAEPELNEELVGADLGAEPHVIVVRADSPLATREQVAAEELCDRPLIAFTRELGSSRMAEQFFAPLGHYPLPAFEVDDFRVMKELIRRGVGYGILPVSTIEGDPDLVGIAPNFPLERRLVVLRSAKRMLSPQALDVCAHLSENWEMREPIEEALAPSQARDRQAQAPALDP